MRYGQISEIKNYNEATQRAMLISCESLKNAFVLNGELLKTTNKTIKQQIEELRVIYGMRVTSPLLSELKNGKRYKTGFVLLATLKDYWHSKGYEFNVIL